MEQIGAIAELIDALKKLPGVGPRAAQRIAYQLLNGDRSDANRLGEALLKATKTVHAATALLITAMTLCFVLLRALLI